MVAECCIWRLEWSSDGSHASAFCVKKDELARLECCTALVESGLLFGCMC
jgi:hypothetical protein